MKTVAASLALALAVSVSACGSESDDGSDGPRISATTGVLADITEQVAGDDARVERVIPEGSTPHDFQLSATDRAEIDDSILLVYNGLGLEPGVPIDEVDVPTFALAQEDGESDPHVWMDPTRVAGSLPALAEALAQADPEHAEGYRSRARNYADELEALDGELREMLADVPGDERELVTSHDALGYFAARYDFTIVATPFPASGAEAEPSAARIRDVQQVIRRTGVPAVFAEEGDDPEVLGLIADDTGVEVVDGLLVESPGSAGSYVEMLRHDAELIAEALGRGSAQGA